MREAHGYWGFLPDRIDGRMLVAEGLAEREELGSNVLLICNPNLARARGAGIQLACWKASKIYLTKVRSPLA